MGLLMLTLEDTLGDIKGRGRDIFVNMTSKKHLPPPLKISALHSSNASIEI